MSPEAQIYAILRFPEYSDPSGYDVSQSRGPYFVPGANAMLPADDMSLDDTDMEPHCPQNPASENKKGESGKENVDGTHRNSGDSGLSTERMMA